MSYMIGIDTGGTFTDLIVVDSEGGSRLFKSPTTIHNPTESIFAGLEKAAAALDMPLSQLLSKTTRFAHGSTHGVNAIVQRRGATVGAMVTRGFRDTLEIRRMKRNSTFDVLETRPRPFVRRDRVKEIDERLDRSGNVLTPLDMHSVEQALDELILDGVSAIAICFLHSYVNPLHERSVADYIRGRHPGIYVSVSSELVQEIREYERMSTAVFNAYIGDMVARHFTALTEKLEAKGLRTLPLIMQLHGGLTTTRAALKHPVTTLFSGPVAGVVGAMHYGRLLGFGNLLTMDMGGTSFDVNLVTGGEPAITKTMEVESFPLLLPRVAVESIGAGGGSIAWIDESGVLRVGPQSAGAVPGPACYGRGGDRATVTDADVVLGYIDPNYFLGGEHVLDIAASNAAIDKLAQPLGLDRVAVAAGIYEIVNANMYNAVRLITIDKGVDPRDLTAVAFGGAGGSHAAVLHEELGTSRLIVPLFAAGFSAFGLLVANMKHSFNRTFKASLKGVDLESVNGVLNQMAQEARAILDGEGVSEDARQTPVTLELRYSGQLHNIEVPAPRIRLTNADIPAIQSEFERRYSGLYGFVEEDVPIMIVGLRVDAIGLLESPNVPMQQSVQPGAPLPKGKRSAYFGDRFVDTPVFEAQSLVAGQSLAGPAVVESPVTTIVVRPGQSVEVDRCFNLVFTRSTRGAIS